VVPDRDAAHAGADGFDHAAPLMTEHGGAGRLCSPVDGVPVGVAHAARAESDEDLSRPGIGELELGGSEGTTGLLEDDTANLQAVTGSFSSLRWRARNSSIGM
jgi:hypothetical protein